MHSGPEIERGNLRIREVEADIPYRKIISRMVITLLLQTAGTLALACYLDKTSAAELLDIGTMLAVAVFICGALMWGRFPGADEPFVDPMDRDRSLHDMRDMSITSRARGAVLMLSSVLYVMACIGANWVANRPAAITVAARDAVGETSTTGKRVQRSQNSW